METNKLLSTKYLPKNFSEPDAIYAYLQSGMCFAVIFGATGIGIQSRNWIVLAICFFIIGIMQYRLSVVLHDCIHLTLFKGKQLNMWVGRVSAALLFTTFTNFQSGHMAHHRYYRTEDDPSLPDYEVHPKTTKDLVWFLLQPLIGYSVFIKIWQFRDVQQGKTTVDKETKGGNAQAKKTPVVEIVLLGLIQGILFLWTSRLFAQPIYYIGLVMLPVMSIVLFLSRLRTFLEHGDPHADDHPPLNCGRNTLTSIIERAILSPLNFNYHYWHHKYPQIPSSKLPELHTWYLEKDPEVLSDPEQAEVNVTSFYSTFTRFYKEVELKSHE
ncbi:MAG: fatty acid desaturase [Anaerolineales bacterium]|nr:fatty acid desaturase [Anaerolineales bacterium]